MRRKHSVYATLVIDRHCCLKLNYVEEDQDRRRPRLQLIDDENVILIFKATSYMSPSLS